MKANLEIVKLTADVITTSTTVDPSCPSKTPDAGFSE